MADPPPLSAASRLVLEELRGADGKAVLKLAIRELVAAGAYTLVHDEPRRRLGRSRPRLLLVATGVRSDGDALLAWTQTAIAASPSELHGVRTAHEVAAVAKSIARDDAKVRKRVVERTLADLERRGLVAAEERRVLGVVPRTRWARTAAGDAQLAEPPDSRRRGDTRADGGAVHAGHVEGGRHDELDSSLDSSFDSSFDSAFDSSFDSGFSDGGGDGGGGGGGGDGGSG